MSMHLAEKAADHARNLFDPYESSSEEEEESSYYSDDEETIQAPSILSSSILV